MTAWCLGEANAAFMRKLGIDARACDVPVGDELFKRDPAIRDAMATGDEAKYMAAIAKLLATYSPAIAASLVDFHDTLQVGARGATTAARPTAPRARFFLGFSRPVGSSPSLPRLLSPTCSCTTPS